MTTATRQSWTIWVCSNCLMHAANGECGDCHEEKHEGGEPLSLLSVQACPGMGWEDHEDECLTHIIRDLKERFPDVDWPDVPGDYECDCETRGYSTSSCDGCGSTYHGDRYAMTEWSD
ncbi:hypothetical protein ACWEVY_28825 [Streptomyces longwoodensis]